MRLNLRVFHKGLILVGLPLALNFILVALLFYLVLQADRERLDEFRHKKMGEDTTRLAYLTYDAGCAVNSAFQQMRPELFHHAKESLVALAKTRKELMDLAKQDPADYAQFEKLLITDNPLHKYNYLLADFANHKVSTWKLLQVLASAKKEVRNTSVIMSTNYRRMLAQTEHYLDTAPKKQAALRQMEFAILIGGTLLNIATAMFLARFFMTDIVSRLKVMTDNTNLLANEQPLNPQLEGKDEIAELDHVFHQTAEALYQAAQHERAAFDEASEVICVLDADGKFTRINAACKRLWGRQPDELVGVSIADIVAQDDVERTNGCVLAARSDQPAAEFENRIRHHDGQLISVVWSVYWSDADEALFCVVHDITERNQVEQMKQDFLSMVSHDLRSPLTSIYGVFKLLTARAFGELPQLAAAKLDSAAKNVNRLLVLVNDLLDIEKLDAGHLDLERTDISVADLLRRSVQDVETLAEQRKIAIAIDCPDTRFPLDPDRMIQVFVNLLSNAIKFSPDGGTVTIAASPSPDLLEISFKDHGRGVPASHREVIFDRFKQVEAADGKRKTGTGLGLPICKKIVELHGGQISVESEEGAGSTFWLKIPRTTAAAETTRLSAMARPLPLHTPPAETDDSRSPVSAAVRRSSFSPFSRLSLAQKGLILVGVPVVLGLIFVVTLSVTLIKADQETSRERHNRTIALNASKFLMLMCELGTTMSEDRSLEGWNRFETAAGEIPAVKAKLIDLTRDDPQLKALLSAVTGKLAGAAYFISRAESIVRSRGYAPAVLDQAFRTRGKLEPTLLEALPLIDQVATQARKMEGDSPARLAELRLMQGEIMLSALALSVLTSVGLAIFFGNGITSRLYTLGENTQRIAENRALKPPLAGSDEIAHLDMVFHKMAKTLKAARQKERAVFDNSLDVICALDGRGAFRQINSACESMWGYADDWLLKRSLTDITISDHTDITDKAIASNHQDGKARSFENRILCKDGSPRDMLWSYSWSETEERFFCTAHDISKRRELERLKQEFLAMVSHDLRTPLTTIFGITKLAQAGALGELPEKAQQQLQVIARNVDRLLILINDLLDIEKLESGQMQLTIEKLPVFNLLEQSAQSLDTMAKQKRVNLIVEPTESCLAADGDRLTQVLINLLSNAIKFSPEGGTVTLSASTSPDYVEIRVKDEGRGIPDSYKESIFERYKQVESSDGKRNSGTGLGLPICKQIVELHGGKIEVISSVGKGSTFSLRFPLRESSN